MRFPAGGGTEPGLAQRPDPGRPQRRRRGAKIRPLFELRGAAQSLVYKQFEPGLKTFFFGGEDGLSCSLGGEPPHWGSGTRVAPCRRICDVAALAYPSRMVVKRPAVPLYAVS